MRPTPGSRLDGPIDNRSAGWHRLLKNSESLVRARSLIALLTNKTRPADTGGADPGIGRGPGGPPHPEGKMSFSAICDAIYAGWIDR
jgi:hypothetical protein